MDDILFEDKAKLWGSLLLFTQVFYKLRTGRDFILSNPMGRESHYITICRALTKVFRGETNLLYIALPPRYGKTELIINFIAWAISKYPDSNFIYTSYAHSLAKKQTQTTKQIITLPHYKKIFNVELSQESNAKDNFETTDFGSVFAAGSGGPITGRGAGIKGIDDRFGGAIIIDDIHKPNEVTSDVVRDKIKDWYYNTLQSRVNGPHVPKIIIGHRLHEDDLPANLIESGEWETCIVPALDLACNALHPEMHTKEALLKMKEENPYVYAAQYNQDPQPSGGGIFKPEWFFIREEEPEILTAFITIDTAETDKNYNDATVFSYFGLYKINDFGIESEVYGLHWLDCYEIRVDPKDLEPEFMLFYAACCRHKVKPSFAAIEKKSTGVTLYSVLNSYQGLKILPIDRTKYSGNKASRYLEMQPFVASKRISLPEYGKHTKLCIEHCRKITANNSHRFDDICDTLYDAVKVSLIDKTLINRINLNENNSNKIVQTISNKFNHIQSLRRSAYEHYGRR